MKSNKKLKWIFGIILVVLILSGIGIYAYVNDYYHAEPSAREALESTEKVTVKTLTNHATAFEPMNPKAGVVFYPGGKVENIAYAPLMKQLAERDILAILVKMPWNLAVLDVNAADHLQENYPEIEEWYIAGHSLGGSMAATYINKHKEEFDGLILLAAYSTENLQDSNLQVISILGDQDGVLNKEKYESNRSNLPDGYQEKVIEGGCHAYFGSYGMQKNDGIPTVTPEEQQSITAEYISSCIDEKMKEQ